MRKILGVLCVAALLLSGCGGLRYRARVHHLLASDLAGREGYQALQSLYVVVQKPAPPDEGLGGQLLTKLFKNVSVKRDVEIWVEAFASALQKDLSPVGGHVLAYQVVHDLKEADPFLKRLGPTGILHLKLDSPDFQSEAAEKTAIILKTKTEKKQTVKTKVWRQGVKLRFEASLVSYPERKALGKFSDTLERKRERPRAKEEPEKDWQEKWFRKEVEKKFLTGLSKLVTKRFAPRAVQRRRPIYADKEVPALKEAQAAAKNNNWAHARKIWKGRLESGAGDWRDRHNLAVDAEKRGDLEEARRFYEEARQAGAEVSKTNWDRILKDLSLVVSKIAAGSRAAPEWFSQRLAVLPFSDETGSVDGPILVRNRVHEMLRLGGYAVIPLEEVDLTLRQNGFSQGGQLGAARPSNIAKWLSAKRLLYGNLTNFDEVMVGVYHKRKVAGKLTLWDHVKKRQFWVLSEEAIRQAVHTKDAAAHFLGQLAGGLIERIRKKPLSPETERYVRRSVERLPRLPPQEPATH